MFHLLNLIQIKIFHTQEEKKKKNFLDLHLKGIQPEYP